MLAKGTGLGRVGNQDIGGRKITLVVGFVLED